MTEEEDEEFERVQREINISRVLVRRRAEEDDDIQDYKKSWVGLTDREMMDAIGLDDTPMESGRKIEQALKEKNT